MKDLLIEKIKELSKSPDTENLDTKLLENPTETIMEFIGKNKDSFQELLQKQDGSASTSSLKKLANKYGKDMSDAVKSGNITSIVTTILQDKEFVELAQNISSELSKDEEEEETPIP
jgi:Ca2+-binding EF-hand superfamily protein